MKKWHHLVYQCTSDRSQMVHTLTEITFLWGPYFGRESGQIFKGFIVNESANARALPKVTSDWWKWVIYPIKKYPGILIMHVYQCDQQ